MRLTNKTEYAILALLHLSRLEPGAYGKADEIADAQKIPRRFLQQIMHELKQAGYIRTERGRGGGYSLVKNPSSINLAEICRFIDGALAPTSAVSTHFYSPAPIEKETKVMSIFKDIRDTISEKLERVTLDML